MVLSNSRKRPQERAYSIKEGTIGSASWKPDEQKWIEFHQKAVETMVKLPEATKNTVKYNG